MAKKSSTKAAPAAPQKAYIEGEVKAGTGQSREASEAQAMEALAGNNALYDHITNPGGLEQPAEDLNIAADLAAVQGKGTTTGHESPGALEDALEAALGGQVDDLIDGSAWGDDEAEDGPTGIEDGQPDAGEEEDGQPDADEAEDTDEGQDLEGKDYIDPKWLSENADTLVPVKVDGEVLQVPVSELLQGYSRQSDYTRKTQALAAQRTQVQEAEELMTASLDAIGQVYDSLAPEVQSRVVAARNEMARRAQVRQAEQVQAEAARLPEVIPAWKDPKVRETEMTGVVDMLRGMGVSDQKIASVTSADELAILRDAMLYRQTAGALDKLAKGETVRVGGKTLRPGGKSGHVANTPAIRSARKKGKALAAHAQKRTATSAIAALDALLPEDF